MTERPLFQDHTSRPDPLRSALAEYRDTAARIEALKERLPRLHTPWAIDRCEREITDEMVHLAEVETLLRNLHWGDGRT